MSPAGRLCAPALAACLLLPVSLTAQAATVILVRHAEKAAPSGDPPLSAPGRARAAALGAALVDFPVTTIITSEYRRTRETAAPLATARGLVPVVVAARSGADSNAAAVARALGAVPAGTAALVVGHSNTLGPIIAALGGPVLPDLCDGEYATLFVLELPPDGAPRLLRARYGAPDPPGATECHPAPPS
ncbi:MAG: histidine phosphatase family protein [Gemmatimonadales bacterium]|jgi:broad specificity phosphatase PhoE|nr:histidine phosphatase family protein [Gemmatimonadota bacterium]MBK7784660.1 histidine phosphatase family protein [Gemmatimonadota bacterium]MBP6669859.1 histidine phosphatase family protein [Gemmatimonadales bacterium]MBP9201813.1 histidine phosphatase family protein [Gemmatimonadales bacterium]